MDLFELGQAPKAMGAQKPLFGDDKTLIKAGLIIGGVIALWKLYIALTANVIWEEGHFAISGLYPALGYPDIPAGFPLLSRMVTLVFGLEVLPLRLVSLVIASAIPFAIYFMSSPLLPKRQAIWAAIVSMLIPPLSISGTIFYPEGLMQLLLALMLGCLLRALSDNRWKWWALTGVCAALGLFVHFRFLVPGLGVVLYALLTPQGRKLWTNPKFLVTGVIASLGVLPSILYNAQNQWPAIAFHVTNRPKWSPDIEFMLSFLGQQIGMVTPIFFVALGFAAKRLVWDERSNHLSLLGIVGVTIFGLYFLQSPANARLMPHWPFMAYVPLVAMLPMVFIGWADAALSQNSRRFREVIIGLAPALALTVGIAISVYQWAWVNTAHLSYQWRALNFMQNENWQPLKADLYAAAQLSKARFGPDPVFAVSGHVSAVRLEFPQRSDNTLYTLDDPYDLFSRFETARAEWSRDRKALMRDQAGKGVVLIIPETSYLYHTDTETAFLDELCQSFEAIEPFKTKELPPGRTSVSLFTAKVRPKPLKPLAPVPCALLPSLYIAQPPRGIFLDPNEDTNYFGMAVDPIGISRVEILIDGKFATEARYGLDPKGSTAPKALSYDPNYPKIQFDFKINTLKIPSGEHRLSVRATRSDGTISEGAGRTFYVK
jgi:hypothetical protein